MRTTRSEPARATGPSPAPRRRPATAAAALLAALVLGLTTACSSDSSGSGSPSAGASTTAASSAPASPAGTAPADVEAAKAQVTANWEKFFDPATPIADKAAVLQNGAALAPALQGFAADPRVGQVKADVTAVDFTSATEATVTYTLSLQGNVVQPAATGTAVLDGGTWKVSTASLCGLVAQAGGATVPGCS
ncbi:hypothetical protein KNE206_00880 [Kitasatospora sp. NE20-6]|uniref:hypothetical protein n=1 Tax=Kitasatospora sp. NE20-6 TaxID=2859066 RepID=UPI0034DC5645